MERGGNAKGIHTIFVIFLFIKITSLIFWSRFFNRTVKMVSYGFNRVQLKIHILTLSPMGGICPPLGFNGHFLKKSRDFHVPVKNHAGFVRAGL